MSKLCQYCKLPIPKISPEGNPTPSKRKACFKCRPFNCFINKSPKLREYHQSLKKQGKKQCVKCLEPKLIENFFIKYKNTNIRYSTCKSCQAQIRRKRRNNLKEQAVAYLGGKCVCCGYKRCMGALNFHHRDPSLKEFQVSQLEGSLESIKPELDKCALVCANCHAEIHGGIRKLPLT